MATLGVRFKHLCYYSTESLHSKLGINLSILIGSIYPISPITVWISYTFLLKISNLDL